MTASHRRALGAVLLAGGGVLAVAGVEARERTELERRARRFRAGRQRIPLAGRTAIVVDDGIATGSTARAACRVARAQGAARVVLAVPVAPPRSIADLRADADEVVCVEIPRDFSAIGQFYADFAQTHDEEVIRCLAQAARRPAPVRAAPVGDPPDPPGRDEEVEVHAGATRLEGHLTIPEGARGIVVFAHGSGSSRHINPTAG